ncbi:MAG TPA: GTP 3',8-cyclase MoaA [Methanocorpusculum sp.]|nr:GTP 3',8-cyclase MoaA [Methanocorpusculum sp.]
MNCSILTDSYGRTITDVRAALTNKCNLKCVYCHSEGECINGCQRHDSSNIIEKDDLIELLNILTDLGVKTIKLTGGEPLLRKDLCDIIRAIPKSVNVSLTTNGILLSKYAEDLKEAGLSRVNVSLDSLNPETYKRISGFDMLSKVLDGIEAALSAGLVPVKINMVVLPGINDNEIDDFIEFVKGKENMILQFIELMDINGWTDSIGETDYSSTEIVKHLEERFMKEAEIIATRKMHHRKIYMLDGTKIEVVRPMHNAEFCANCNRLRITSDGFLKPCLLKSGNEVNIAGIHGEDLKKAISDAVKNRCPFFT